MVPTLLGALDGGIENEGLYPKYKSLLLSPDLLGSVVSEITHHHSKKKISPCLATVGDLTSFMACVPDPDWAPTSSLVVGQSRMATKLSVAIDNPRHTLRAFFPMLAI